MENAARLIITVLFIALMAIGIIFFGFLFIAPLNNKLSSPLQKTTTTSSLENAITTSSEELGFKTTTLTQKKEEKNVLTQNQQNQQSSESGALSSSQEQGNQKNFANTSQSPTPSKTQQNNNLASLSPSDYKLIEQSGVILKESIPQEAIKITFSKNFVSPNTITTNKGRIILAVSSGDDLVHILRFNNPGLSQLFIGVPPYGTRLLIFEIYKSGEFVFYDDNPESNATGKLIIK